MGPWSYVASRRTCLFEPLVQACRFYTSPGVGRGKGMGRGGPGGVRYGDVGQGVSLFRRNCGCQCGGMRGGASRAGAVVGCGGISGRTSGGDVSMGGYAQSSAGGTAARNCSRIAQAVGPDLNYRLIGAVEVITVWPEGVQLIKLAQRSCSKMQVAKYTYPSAGCTSCR